jgi:hypothetical protein
MQTINSKIVAYIASIAETLAEVGTATEGTVYTALMQAEPSYTMETWLTIKHYLLEAGLISLDGDIIHATPKLQAMHQRLQAARKARNN